MSTDPPRPERVTLSDEERAAIEADVLRRVRPPMSTDTPRPKFGVQASVFGSAIYVGRLNAAGNLFTQKEDCTDMALAAVAQYTSRHFDGGVAVEFPHLDGGVRLTVKVERLNSEESTDE